MASVHPQSQEGYASGKSELYDKYRPPYNKEVLSRIRDTVGFGRNLQVVEIGCGSGLFTRAMLEHWSTSLKAIKCYDPNDGMLEVFRKTVNDPRVSVSKGMFEGTGADDGWADLVIIATAFHWCLDLGGAVKEFVRILKPGGMLCFLWNGGDRDVGWVREVFNYGQSVPTDKLEHDFLGWKKLYDLPTYKENFFPPEGETVKYVQPSTLRVQVEQAMTSSAFAALDGDGKREAREKIKEIIERGDGLVWINEEEGSFEAPYSVPIIFMKRN